MLERRRGAILLPAMALLASGCQRGSDEQGGDRQGLVPDKALAPGLGAQGAGPVPEEGPSDEQLERAVLARLELEPALEGAHVRVASEDGIIQLSGETPSLLAAERAARQAEAVRGVRAVTSRIVVEAPGIPDRDLEQRVRSMLLFDAVTDAYEIDVSASNGVVSLAGRVDSPAEHWAAVRTAIGVQGVRAIHDEIEVMPPEDRPDLELEREIEARLRWDVLAQHQLVRVQVTDGRAALNGFAGSVAERNHLRRLAYVSGVRAVDVSEVRIRPWARDPFARRPAEPVSDREVAAAISAALALDPWVDAASIDVSAEQGQVTLRGQTETTRARLAAEWVARHTVGVRDVTNEIEVQPGEDVSDARLRDDVRAALLFNPFTERHEVQVSVKDGIVTLGGRVNTGFERAVAEDLASRRRGVRQVINTLSVRRADVPYVYRWYVEPHGPLLPTGYHASQRQSQGDQELRDEIIGQLRFSPFVDADEVEVTVSHGKATLTGSVDSAIERQTASENALEAGALAVDNQLEVR